MFLVMLGQYDQPVLCWTEDECFEQVGWLDLPFYNHIPAGWLLEVGGAANGACCNL